MTRKHKKKDKDTHMQAALCRPAQRGWMSSLCLEARAPRKLTAIIAPPNCARRVRVSKSEAGQPAHTKESDRRDREQSVELPFAVVSCGALFRLLAAKIVYAYVMYMCMYVMCVLLYRFAGVRVYSICSARRGA
jgi:hypothetical protein